MYRKILLAYDGTLEGAIALREGAILAKQCGAEVQRARRAFAKAGGHG